MPTIQRTAHAEEDLIEIWLYIAADNEAAADRLLDTIEEKLVLLSENPYLGPARPDIAPTLRYFVVKNYLILYEAIIDGIDVVRVVHGARNLADILSQS